MVCYSRLAGGRRSEEKLSKNRRRSIDVGFWLLVLLALVLGYYALYGVNSGEIGRAHV